MPESFVLPRYIAICGNPTAGKSEVQKILARIWGVTPVDDGHSLREFAQDNLGLTWEQVRTQQGKLDHVDILGRRWQVRAILGELGNHLEAMFGKDIMPFMAVQRCEAELKNGSATSFAFGSVRRDQGRFYQARGALVLGVSNPLADPSPYEFDRFDESVVDVWIENDAQARGLDRRAGIEDLTRKVTAAIEQNWKLADARLRAYLHARAA